jgi:hypothetical protein
MLAAALAALAFVPNGRLRIRRGRLGGVHAVRTNGGRRAALFTFCLGIWMKHRGASAAQPGVHLYSAHNIRD